MRRWLTLLCLSLAPALLCADTQIVLVRHAEKSTVDPTNKDPGLTAAGEARAQALAAAVRQFKLDAVYASQFQRTQLTAGPAASAAGLKLRVRPASAEVETDAKAFAESIVHDHKDQAVLVVGHSNTVPALVAALSGAAAEPMPETEYDRLYVVNLADDRKARVLVLRYGAAH